MRTLLPSRLEGTSVLSSIFLNSSWENSKLGVIPHLLEKLASPAARHNQYLNCTLYYVSPFIPRLGPGQTIPWLRWRSGIRFLSIATDVLFFIELELMGDIQYYKDTPKPREWLTMSILDISIISFFLQATPPFSLYRSSITCFLQFTHCSVQALQSYQEKFL